MRHLAFLGWASLVLAPLAVAAGCGGVTDFDYKGPVLDAGPAGAGGTILGGGGGISDGGGGIGGVGNFGGAPDGGWGNFGGGPDGGMGNLGGQPPGGGGSGGVICGGTLCQAPPVPIGQVESCCVGDKCGLTSSFFAGQCIEQNQPGKPDPTCPAQSIQGFTLPGCCKPNKICGVMDQFLGLGCVDPSPFTGQQSPPCGGIVDAGTGGTGGADAATGGAGTGGIDAGTGGSPTDGGTFDGGTPGATTCIASGVTSICSPTQSCCVLRPGPDYCSDKSTACSCSNCDITVVSCDGPEDCASGEICCGTFSFQSNSYTKTQCQTTCSGQTEREICHPNGTCITPNTTCSQSNYLPQYIWRCN